MNKRLIDHRKSVMIKFLILVSEFSIIIRVMIKKVRINKVKYLKRNLKKFNNIKLIAF